MTSSSGEDVPRGMDFLFSRNRLNVAVSRAQALAVVVCSPRLLWARCNTVEQMRLVNALCRSPTRPSGRLRRPRPRRPARAHVNCGWVGRWGGRRGRFRSITPAPKRVQSECPRNRVAEAVGNFRTL